jgi:hypothetical protein
MKQRLALFGLVLGIGLLAGCAGDQAASPSSAVADEDQSAAEEAVSPPDQETDMGQRPPDDAQMNVVWLAMGTLYLQETEVAITPDQAATLLPLWEGVQEALQNAPPAQADVAELLTQIEGAMTQEQNDALASISQEELMAWAQDQGLMPARGEGPGQPPGDAVPPGDQGEPPDDLSPEELATIQAERGVEGFGGFGRFGAPIIGDVIGMLESLAAS